jgi:hypothetical protein
MLSVGGSALADAATVTDEGRRPCAMRKILWRPAEMIIEIDGEPVAAVVTNHAVNGPTDVAFFSALIHAGIRPSRGSRYDREAVTYFLSPIEAS